MAKPLSEEEFALLQKANKGKLAGRFYQRTNEPTDFPFDARMIQDVAEGHQASLSKQELEFWKNNSDATRYSTLALQISFSEEWLQEAGFDFHGDEDPDSEDDGFVIDPYWTLFVIAPSDNAFSNLSLMNLPVMKDLFNIKGTSLRGTSIASKVALSWDFNQTFRSISGTNYAEDWRDMYVRMFRSTLPGEAGLWQQARKRVDVLQAVLNTLQHKYSITHSFWKNESIETLLQMINHGSILLRAIVYTAPLPGMFKRGAFFPDALFYGGDSELGSYPMFWNDSVYCRFLINKSEAYSRPAIQSFMRDFSFSTSAGISPFMSRVKVDVERYYKQPNKVIRLKSESQEVAANGLLTIALNTGSSSISTDNPIWYADSNVDLDY